MKKTLYVAIIAASLIACKKESKEPTKTTTLYYVKVIEVDNDQNTVTETPYKTITITE